MSSYTASARSQGQWDVENDLADLARQEKYLSDAEARRLTMERRQAEMQPFVKLLMEVFGGTCMENEMKSMIAEWSSHKFNKERCNANFQVLSRIDKVMSIITSLKRQWEMAYDELINPKEEESEESAE